MFSCFHLANVKQVSTKKHKNITSQTSSCSDSQNSLSIHSSSNNSIESTHNSSQKSLSHNSSMTNSVSNNLIESFNDLHICCPRTISLLISIDNKKKKSK